MGTIRNLFACLVHERRECVIDLLRNLRYADPDSLILLYNGGGDETLLKDLPFTPDEVLVHPRPQSLSWGKLHPFALDCMRFALENVPFDTLTIVDSDQLALRPGYSKHLSGFLSTRQDVGMLGNSPAVQPPSTRVPPAAVAFKEIGLWRPFLRRFPEGEHKFVHWTFWPSTVFTADAARDLTRLFDNDTELQSILQRSRIWATEEVILPTLTALLGYQIVANPCSYDLVKYRKQYSLHQVDEALMRPDAFWIHPVPRIYHDRRRTRIRDRFDQYSSANGGHPVSRDAASRGIGALNAQPILARMQRVEGWLEEDEARLLIMTTAQGLQDHPGPHALVEVGSHCGRSTVVLGSVVKVLQPDSRVYAVEPGEIGALDQKVTKTPGAFGKLRSNLVAAGLSGTVEAIRSRSFELCWNRPIRLLLIDGLHDYSNVARDFLHFEPWLATGGHACFHDYADYYPGVKAFVHELLASGRYQQESCARSLVVLRKLKSADTADPPAPSVAGPPGTPAAASHPLVSCIMPTHDRRPFVPRAVEYFLRQDYPERELIVVDDGSDSVADLMPADPRVRYLRLPGRLTVGAKRNLACREARGEIIVHWDDDDWSSSCRLSYQVAGMREAEADLCGLDRPLFYDPGRDRAWQYVYSPRPRPWLYGATLCYTRALWERQPFRDVNIGEDNSFVWRNRQVRMAALPDVGFHVSLIHGGNTSPKRTVGSQWQPFPSERIRALITDDYAFYRDLGSSGGGQGGTKGMR